MAERIIHSGKFLNYDNEEVTVTFYSKDTLGPSSQNDLTFSGEAPVSINYNGDVNDIYAPVKTSSCDINIVSPKILDDLYTAKKSDIRVRVEKGTTVSRRVLTFSDNGSVVTSEIDTSSEEGFEIYSRTQFYTDINGDFRFTGRVVPTTGGTAESVTLLYHPDTEKWERDNTWQLELTDQYFYVGSYSYRVTYDGVRHYVQEWSGSGWGQTYNYNVYLHSDTYDCTYDAKHIVHYKDGNVELVYGNSRFTWNRSSHTWVEQTPYVISGGGTYSSIYGAWYTRVRSGSGTVDAFMVNGYSSQGLQQNYVMSVNRSSGTLTPLIPVTVENGDTTMVFTDDDGYVYYLTPDGKVYYWASNISEWVLWLTLGNNVPGYYRDQFSIDYIIPKIGNYPLVPVLLYNDDDEGQMLTFRMSDINHPSVYYRDEPVVTTTETIWEGYKMPNTYSQDLTLNLDEISMTAIDPVSLMKYVTVDKIFDKPNLLTYAEILGKALKYVQLRDSSTLKVERTVTYGSSTHTGVNGLVNLKLQVSNFWDEEGKGCSLYDMVGEMLKPFGLCLVFYNNNFEIYNANKTSGSRVFDIYTIQPSGTLYYVTNTTEQYQEYNFNAGDWTSNNVSNATLEIGSVYDKIIGEASTCIPDYSVDIKDLVDYEDTENYDYTQFNVQRNKHKGYRLQNRESSNVWVKDTDDYWYFLWNAVYRNTDYGLQVYNEQHSSDHSLDGWVNINGAYRYYYGTTGYPGRYGSLLNFYGGDDNPTATGKEQRVDKSVEVMNRITAWATDNGVPPEFMEDSDLVWDFSNTSYTTEQLSKPDYTDTSKFGVGKTDTANPTRVVFKQDYNHMTLYDNNKQVVTFDITQSYSRSGIPTPVDVINGNNTTAKMFNLGIEGSKYRADLGTATGAVYPYLWNYDRVIVDDLYFSRYRTSSSGLISPVWDRRRVYVYVNANNRIYQFNGWEWVEDSVVRDENCFFLLKLMNYENLYHTDYKYNVIELPDVDSSSVESRRYSLTDQDIIYYTDNNGAVVKNATSSHTQHKYTPYMGGEHSWTSLIDKSGDGTLTIILPFINATDSTVTVQVSCSSMLGMTGGDALYNDSLLNNKNVPFISEINGQGTYQGQTITLTESNCWDYGELLNETCRMNFLPACVTYVKGEHTDVNISVSVPESNLGKMFSASDIKYQLTNPEDFEEEFKGPSFQVNTYNSLVISSYSYLLFGDSVADPGQFWVNGINARPEAYVVQAYMKWLGQIRKIYGKTLVPHHSGYRRFCNIKTFLTSPEIGNNKLMVITDTWDVKTNRHTIKAVECDNLQVSTVEGVTVTEIPRMARAERWNLPTAK